MDRGMAVRLARSTDSLSTVATKEPARSSSSSMIRPIGSMAMLWPMPNRGPSGSSTPADEPSA